MERPLCDTFLNDETVGFDSRIKNQEQEQQSEHSLLCYAVKYRRIRLQSYIPDYACLAFLVGYTRRGGEGSFCSTNL